MATGLPLVCQHRLTLPDDLIAVDAVLFTTSGVPSVVMCRLFLFAKMQSAP